MLRDMVRDFVNSEIRPIAMKIDEEEKIPPELIKKMAELGLLGAVFPPEYGGGGFGEVGYCLMQEEIARACMSTATFIGAHQSIGSNAIYIGGSEALKKKYLVPLAEGRMIGAFALTEVLAGSDSFNLRTKARAGGGRLGDQRREDVDHERRSRRRGLGVRPHGSRGSRRSSWRPKGRGSMPAPPRRRWGSAEAPRTRSRSKRAGARRRT